MPVINDLASQLIEWLKLQPLAPVPREFTLVGALPPAAYPHIAVLLEEERFAPGSSDVTAELSLTVTCTAGRPAEAQQASRSLAHQLRLALIRSHDLGGAVKHLAVKGIVHASELSGAAEPLVIASAELAVEAKYCEAQI